VGAEVDGLPAAAYTARGGVGTVAALRELAPSEVEATSETGAETGGDTAAATGPNTNIAPEGEREPQRKAA
jgi:hypothetical protein